MTVISASMYHSSHKYITLYIFYSVYQVHGSFKSKRAMLSRSTAASDGKFESHIERQAKAKAKAQARSTASSKVMKAYAETTSTTSSKVTGAAIKTMKKNKSMTCMKRKRPGKRQPETTHCKARASRAGPHARSKAHTLATPRPSLRPPVTSEVTPPVGIVAADRQLTDLGAVQKLHARIMHVILCLLHDLHGLPGAIIDDTQEMVEWVFHDFRNTVLTGVEGQYFEESVRSSCNQTCPYVFAVRISMYHSDHVCDQGFYVSLES